jgi:hypothetical protein
MELQHQPLALIADQTHCSHDRPSLESGVFSSFNDLAVDSFASELFLLPRQRAGPTWNVALEPDPPHGGS